MVMASLLVVNVNCAGATAGVTKSASKTTTRIRHKAFMKISVPIYGIANQKIQEKSAVLIGGPRMCRRPAAAVEKP
jgi:hypothetical protein